MKLSASFFYTTKIWLITILIAPVILLFILSSGSFAAMGHFTKALPLLIPAFIYAAVISLPSFFIVWWLVNRLLDSETNVWLKKSLVGSVTIFLIVLSLLIPDPAFFTPFSVSELTWPGTYFITFLIVVFILPFAKKYEKESITL